MYSFSPESPAPRRLHHSDAEPLFTLSALSEADTSLSLSEQLSTSIHPNFKILTYFLLLYFHLDRDAFLKLCSLFLSFFFPLSVSLPIWLHSWQNEWAHSFERCLSDGPLPWVAAPGTRPALVSTAEPNRTCQTLLMIHIVCFPLIPQHYFFESSFHLAAS